MSDAKELSLAEMVQNIKIFRYPMNTAFVTIWWWNLQEAAKLKQLLTGLGYKVFSYKNGDEVEIRFAYTRNVGSLAPKLYLD